MSVILHFFMWPVIMVHIFLSLEILMLVLMHHGVECLLKEDLVLKWVLVCVGKYTGAGLMKAMGREGCKRFESADKLHSIQLK